MANTNIHLKWIITICTLLATCIPGQAANWLCFTAEEDSSLIWYKNAGGNGPSISCRINDGEWEDLGEGDTVILQHTGDKAFFRGDNPQGFSNSKERYTHFGMAGRISASGSVTSLIDGNGKSIDIPNDYCFERLFYGCEAMVNAPILSSYLLRKFCYEEMFYGCSNLTIPPELPATSMEEGCYAGLFAYCTRLKGTPILAASSLAPACYKGMFMECDSLTSAGSLIAKTLAPACYEAMFSGCSGLVRSPVLPAAEVAPSCYKAMFSGCDNLTKVAGLSAGILAESCYEEMYSGCIKLEKTPPLSAQTLAENCYAGMFSGCTNLTQVGELPTTDLEKGCFSRMFEGCTSLAEAPELSVSELAESCYESMFSGCTSLTKAPELPAKELKEKCYKNMFTDCISLNYIKVGVMSLDNEFEATDKWVEGVDDKGTFIFPCGSTYDKHGDSEVPDSFQIISSPIAIFQNPDGVVLWRDTVPCGETPEYHGDTPTYDDGLVFKDWDKELTPLTELGLYYYTAEYEIDIPVPTSWLSFMSREEGSYFSYKNFGGNNPDVQYSTDWGDTWIPLKEGERVEIENVNDRVYIKGNNPNGFSHGEETYTQFEIEGTVEISGSVMSLVDGRGASTIIPSDYCFAHLFENCKINRIMEMYPLPALTLKAHCYSYMFAGCEKLLGPVMVLPATQLEPYCYSHMFEGCTSIANPSELPAEELAEGCYSHMYSGCSYLCVFSGSFASLPATKLAPYCYSGMFSDCVSIYEAPELPASNLEDYCYEAMFSGCTILKKAPLLRAKKLAKGCYSQMFSFCESLNNVFALPAEDLSEQCYYHMFDGCTNLAEVPSLPATKTESGCYDGMFRGCASLVKAPELPAQELSQQCYRSMFEGCSSLNYIKVGVMSLDNDFEATDNWVKGVDGTGTFIFPCGSTYNKRGDSEVPKKFEIISSPIVIFQNPDSAELWRDTIGCDVAPEYKGATPTFLDGLIFSHWDKPLAPLRETGTYYFTAEYGSVDNPELDKVLCFTAVKPNSSIWYRNSNGNQPDIQYSLDLGKTWIPWQANDTVELNRVGDRVYVKGNNPQGFSHGEAFVQKTTSFCMSGGISASGSVMSLIDGLGETTVIPCDSCFYGLFYSCDALLKAPQLTATTLANACYMSMFSSCSNLQEAPDLPATELASRCYSFMFQGTKLTTPPVLPATKLADGCYNGMFFMCKELTKTPQLPATELAPNCYSYMFQYCENLTQVTDLPAMKMEDYCYCGMFSDCGRLLKSPDLPAVELDLNCYASMFYACTLLVRAPELPATELADGCYSSMFVRCERLTEAPELPANELKRECYKSMFERCYSLNYIKVGVKSLDNDFYATNNWVESVDRKGTFIFPCGSTYDKHGYSEVPPNFDIIASPIVIFQNPDSTELQRDTIDCETVPEYRGDGPTYGDGLVFKNWDKEPTVHTTPDVYYYTAVYEEKTIEITDVDIPACDSFVLKGITYHEDMEWSDTLRSIAGSDSIVTYHVNIHKSVVESTTIVAEESYTWKDIIYTEDASWEDTLMTANGCDSIVHYQLIIQRNCVPTSVTDVNIPACDSFVYKGITYRESKDWNDTLFSINGCDSIIAYHLTVHKSVVTEKNISAEESYTWKEFTFTEDASWEDTLTTAFGCDSIVRYQLIIKKDCATDYVTDVNIPACDSFVYKGITYHESKDWNDTLFSIAGCDSIVAYHLTIHKSVVTEANISAEGSYTWKEITFTEDASWNDTLQTAFGCDSIIMYHLNIKEVTPNPATITDIPLTACDSLVFEGVTYRESAEWNDTLSAANGGDSILAYHLTLHKSVVTEENISAEGSYTWKEFTFTEDASWSDTLRTAFGCDSIIRYNLKIEEVTTPNPATITDIPLTACDSLVFEGVTYRESREWNDTLPAADGGDSILAYHLTIHKSVVADESLTAKDSYTWKDVTYTEDASWNDTLQTALGCDSIVRYHLTIEKEKPDLQLTVNDKLYLVLPGGSETISYELTGGEGSKYEVRYNSQAICSGNVANDSTVSLNCPSNLEPGAYNATLEMCDDEGNCAEKDFTFNVMRPDDKQKSFYVKVWNDVVICRNGGGVFQTFQWYKNGKKCEKDTLQYLNDVALLDGEYMVFVKETSGKSYFIEPIHYDAVEATYTITAEPNVVARNTDFTLTVTGVDEEELSHARIVVYRADGVVEKIVDEVEAQSTMRLKAGEYVIVLTVRDGKNANCKVLSR